MGRPQSLNRRALDIWNGDSQAYELLRRTALRQMMEPAPQCLSSNATLAEVGRAFVEKPDEFFYISSDGQTLEGIVTITDLVRARSSDLSANSSVREFMSKHPVALAADEDCAAAYGAMREYRLKNLPVVETKENRKLVGCIRARRLMAYVFQKNSSEATESAKE